MTALRPGALPSDTALYAVHPGSGAGGLPTLRRHSLDAVAGGEGFVPGLDGVRHFPVGQGEGAGPARRPVRRAAQRVTNLGRFFGSGAPAPGSQALSITTGASAGSSMEDVFVEAALPTGPQLLHLRGAKKLPADMGGVESATLHSGICLFSNRALTFWDEAGDHPPLLRHLAQGPVRPLRKITAADELSLYEHLSLTHLPRGLAAVAACLPTSLPLEIVVEVPRVQYYGYLLDAVRRGLAPHGLALEWFDLVDARHERVARHFRQRLRAELAAVGRLEDVQVRCPSPGLDLLAAPIRDALSAGSCPSHEDLVAILADSGDAVWELLLEHEAPRTYTHINDASYIVEVLRGAGLLTGGKGLAVVADSYEEKPRRDHAQRFLDTVGGQEQSLAVGVYLTERLLTVDAHGRPVTPYLNDPGRYAVDESGATLDLFELIEDLYRSPLSVPTVESRVGG